MPVITQHRIEKFRSINSVRQPFWGSATATPGGGQQAVCQLFNPVGSGYVVFPEAMYVSMSGNGTRLIELRELDVATGTLETTIQNKFRGAANSFGPFGELYQATIAGPPGTPIASLYIAQGQPQQILNGHEVRLLEGQGLAVNHVDNGIDLTVLWEWKEIEIVV